MFPNARQRGSSLVVAIFIILVMSVLAAVLARVLTVSSASVVDEVVGARALHAANSGAQVFLTELFPVGQEDADGAACDAGSAVNFSTAGLVGCSAEVSCTQANYDDYGLSHFRILSVGQCSADTQSYSREIVVEAVDGNF